MFYTVGEMAKRLEVSPSTLRYYDQEGLIPFVERSRGGIRMFSDQDYQWLRVVECLKRSGLSIKEIKAYTQLSKKGDASLKERQALFEARKQAVEDQIEQMKETLQLLEYKCWYYQQAIEDGTEDRVRSMKLEDIPEPYRSIKIKAYSLDTESALEK